jgi:hypothetical protein
MTKKYCRASDVVGKVLEVLVLVDIKAGHLMLMFWKQ